jgi:hypothetical protein
MKILKKMIRIIVLTFIMLLAVAGMPAIFPDYKDQYQHKKIRKELVDKEDDDD